MHNEEVVVVWPVVQIKVRFPSIEEFTLIASRGKNQKDSCEHLAELETAGVTACRLAGRWEIIDTGQLLKYRGEESENVEVYELDVLDGSNSAILSRRYIMDKLAETSLWAVVSNELTFGNKEDIAAQLPVHLHRASHVRHLVFDHDGTVFDRDTLLEPLESRAVLSGFEKRRQRNVPWWRRLFV